MKKFFISVLVLGIILVCCVFYFFIPKSISDMYGKDLLIQKVYLISGNTGVIILLDEDQQNEIIRWIDDTKISREYFQKDNTGWLYRLQIISNKETIDIVFNINKLKINKKQYCCDEKDISKMIDCFSTIEATNKTLLKRIDFICT